MPGAPSEILNRWYTINEIVSARMEWFGPGHAWNGIWVDWTNSTHSSMLKIPLVYQNMGSGTYYFGFAHSPPPYPDEPDESIATIYYRELGGPWISSSYHEATPEYPESEGGFPILSLDKDKKYQAAIVMTNYLWWGKWPDVDIYEINFCSPIISLPMYIDGTYYKRGPKEGEIGQAEQPDVIADSSPKELEGEEWVSPRLPSYEDDSDFVWYDDWDTYVPSFIVENGPNPDVEVIDAIFSEGGRHKNRLVVVGHQQIYFGEV